MQDVASLVGTGFREFKTSWQNVGWFSPINWIPYRSGNGHHSRQRGAEGRLVPPSPSWVNWITTSAVPEHPKGIRIGGPMPRVIMHGPPCGSCPLGWLRPGPPEVCAAMGDSLGCHAGEHVRLLTKLVLWKREAPFSPWKGELFRQIINLSDMAMMIIPRKRPGARSLSGTAASSLAANLVHHCKTIQYGKMPCR